MNEAGSRYNWTAERIAILRKLYKQGAKDAEIADRLGTTERSVNGKRQRLGLYEPRSQGAKELHHGEFHGTSDDQR
ncbi:MAG TPA: GcrA family cell cycle regulator [Mycobacterium sp.]